jgi:hypothetical protein
MEAHTSAGPGAPEHPGSCRTEMCIAARMAGVNPLCGSEAVSSSGGAIICLFCLAVVGYAMIPTHCACSSTPAVHVHGIGLQGLRLHCWMDTVVTGHHTSTLVVELAPCSASYLLNKRPLVPSTPSSQLSSHVCRERAEGGQGVALTALGALPEC